MKRCLLMLSMMALLLVVISADTAQAARWRGRRGGVYIGVGTPYRGYYRGNYGRGYSSPYRGYYGRGYYSPYRGYYGRGYYGGYGYPGYYGRGSGIYFRF